MSMLICNLAAKSASGTNLKTGSGFKKYVHSLYINMNTKTIVMMYTEKKVQNCIKIVTLEFFLPIALEASCSTYGSATLGKASKSSTVRPNVFFRCLKPVPLILSEL